MKITLGFVGGSKGDAAAGAREEIEILIGVSGDAGEAVASAVVVMLLLLLLLLRRCHRIIPSAANEGGGIVISVAAIHVGDKLERKEKHWGLGNWIEIRRRENE